jgi:peptidoglycan/LPS O-acetylase OafA/YrhL
LGTAKPPITITDPAEFTYYPALDGIRGTALLLVLLCHNFSFLPLAKYGWIGLDIFFVLSGFLITDIILNTCHKKNFLRNFYTRRALRILPLYYGALVVYLFILPAFINLPDAIFYREHQLWFWTYTQNWLIILHGTDQITSLDHLWSLAVEEQFYLLWPLIILLIRSHKKLMLFLGVILLFAFIARWWIWDQQIEGLSYFKLFTFTRIDGLCIGSLLAIARKSRPNFKNQAFWVIAGVLICNGVFILVRNLANPPLPYLALAGYLSLALLLGLLIDHLAGNKYSLAVIFFSTPLLRFFGKISYGVYVMHWPVYQLTKPYLFKWLEKSGVPIALMIGLITSSIALILGWLSFRFFESYFLRLKKKFA